MQDLVRILETYCQTQNYFFAYGSEAHLELLDGELDDNKIYLLLFPVKRRSIINTNSTKVQGRRYEGRFMLLKGSDYANHYFNENEKDQATSKYTINIEPLITIGEGIVENLMCNDIEVETYENDDVINTLDSNKDGLWYRFVFVQRV